MNKPLALYIHFPWCVRKCPYCDFNSHEFGVEIPEQAYISALIQDLERDIEHFNIEPGTNLTSIFMGGGTPSLFSGGAIQQLMDAVRDRFSMSDHAEITMEANPGTTDSENFRGYFAAGINRISLGIQSFGKHQLQTLGRIHTSNQASEAYWRAREAGFENINLDLMHGLPAQDLALALKDLEIAVALNPEHISWYQLTIEPNTVFYNRPPQLPDDDTLWQIFTEGTSRLEDAGYTRYEVSAFCKPQAQSAHNLNYWQFGDYLGIGAGAHGKMSSLQGASMMMTRTSKTRGPADYLRQQKTRYQSVTEAERPIEFLMNSLRLIEGVSLSTFRETTGLPVDLLDSFLLQGQNKGLLETQPGRIKPTALGIQYLNDLLLLAADHTEGF